MRVILFKPEFAVKVVDGTKTQTVRRDGKRNPKPGDVLSLRQWSGLPYRSKQITLKETNCSSVSRVRIHPLLQEIEIQNTLLHNQSANDFARADGFSDRLEMFAWFWNTYHIVEFHGICIQWNRQQPKTVLPLPK